MTQPFLSVVLPMYNEAAIIGEVIQSLTNLFATCLTDISYEIIIVDDGSTDGSAAQVSQVNDLRIQLCQHPYNIGNGAAVKTGIRQASGEYILLMDADGQHKTEDIPRLLEYIDRYDLVVGARTRQSDTAVHRDIANIIYNGVATYVCDMRIQDLTSGFRVIRADITRSNTPPNG